jgi:hypothetical protein
MPTTSRVYMQTVPPGPSWTAWKLRNTGALTIADGRAEFRPNTGDAFVLSDIRRVGKGWKHQSSSEPLLPIVDTGTEVVYGAPEDPTVAFFNDSRWLGLSVYLPHRPLLAALQSVAR